MLPVALPTVPLSENVFVILRDLIHERTGLTYAPDKRDLLADRLSPRVHSRRLTSFLDYYYLLKYDQDAMVEWRHVHDALAVPETYFWREIDQVRVLVDHVVPRFFAEMPGQTLRIWSASCSTGEEPLSIAMALADAGVLDRWPVEIWASDASPAAVQAGRRGVYRQRSFRTLPMELRERYFTETSEGWKIASDLQSRVQWAEANLIERGAIWPLAMSHVIFCRNTFIYFSPEATQRTVQTFAEAMPAFGFLFVGVSESLLNLTDDFELQEIGNAFVYVKHTAPQLLNSPPAGRWR